MVNTWRIVIAALLIFASGAFTGALCVGAAGTFARPRNRPAPARADIVRPATPILTQESVRTDVPALGSPPPGAARLEVYRRLERELDLNVAQQEHLRRLLDETDRRLHSLWDPVAPQAREALRDLRHRIKNEVLRPEQRSRFERFLQNRSGNDRPPRARPAEPALPGPTPPPETPAP